MNLKFGERHNLAFHQFWLLTCEHNLLGGLSYVSLRPSFAPRAKLTFHLPQCSYCQICPRIATLFLIGIFVSITKWAGTQISKWARLIIIIVTYDSTCPLGALGLVYRFHSSSGTWRKLTKYKFVFQDNRFVFQVIWFVFQVIRFVFQDKTWNRMRVAIESGKGMKVKVLK